MSQKRRKYSRSRSSSNDEETRVQWLSNSRIRKKIFPKDLNAAGILPVHSSHRRMATRKMEISSYSITLIGMMSNLRKHDFSKFVKAWKG